MEKIVRIYRTMPIDLDVEDFVKAMFSADSEQQSIMFNQYAERLSHLKECEYCKQCSSIFEGLSDGAKDFILNMADIINTNKEESNVK